MGNRRFMIKELLWQSLLHEIVTKHSLFKKLCARWVLKNLTPEHKIQRLGEALTFLQRYHDDGDEFLHRIVTGDETSLHPRNQAAVNALVDLRSGRWAYSAD
ncbi:uncharacterized protein TNCV_4111641 [Trichonephila clavipes]|nr:uncharacterized protein TNCV_4111641 [Trichonephila clavipes]